MLFQYIAAQAADLDMYAKIEGNIIPKSTHYRLVQSTKHTVYLNHNAPPIEIVTQPQAIFYGYNREKHKKIFLGVIDINDFKKSTIKYLDLLIDSTVSLPTIKSATILHCPHRGRILYFFDQEGNLIDFSLLHYIGSRDLKFAEKNNIRLPKPHSLLRQLEEVKEYVPKSSYAASGYKKHCLRYESH